LGLNISTKGSRIYAALKGVLDSGIKVPHSEDILPSEDRIKGKHISEDLEKQFENIKSKIVG
jgi:large subunit ribosomal protein L18